MQIHEVLAFTGQGAGNSATFTHTHIEGGQQVVIASGADTTLQGVTLTGKQVTAQVGSDPASYHALQAAGGYEAANDGNPEFVRTWQNLARDTGFAEQQHNFVDTRKFQSAYSYAEKLIPNLDQRSEVLKEIIWSGAVQHGRVKDEVLKEAWKYSANASDEELIRQFYSRRLGYAEEIGLDMRKRYSEELTKALDWVNKPRSQWR